MRKKKGTKKEFKISAVASIKLLPGETLNPNSLLEVKKITKSKKKQPKTSTVLN